MIRDLAKLGGAMAVVAALAILTFGLASAETDTRTVPTESPTEEADLLSALPALANRGTETEARQASAEREEKRRGPVTGFPLPRYVSMSASEGNARRGPSRSHRIDWVFTRRNMPLVIVAEHGHWRRVVDRDGVGGWMHYSLLSGVRTAIVEADMLPLYSRPDANSPVRARAELGVIGRLRECRPNWCLMEVGGHRGWVDPRALWGVEAGEAFD